MFNPKHCVVLLGQFFMLYVINVTPCGNTARVSGMWLGQQRFPSRQENDGYCMTQIQKNALRLWLVNLPPPNVAPQK